MFFGKCFGELLIESLHTPLAKTTFVGDDKYALPISHRLTTNQNPE